LLLEQTNTFFFDLPMGENQHKKYLSVPITK